MVHFVGVHFTPNDASGSSPLGAASLGSFAAARKRVPLSLVCRGWKITTPDDGFDSLRFLDGQGKGSMKYLAPAWVVRATTRAQRVPRAATFRD